MATYAVGDIQGCYRTFRALLDQLSFDPARDRLWLVGDIVNRGPASLDVLRWARDHDAQIHVVLGNHDLHLLARHAGVRPAKQSDTLDEILAAPDRKPLLEWLARRPLIHREGSWVMVHAGLHPTWTIEKAEALAREAEACLHGPQRRELLETLQAPLPERWDETCEGVPRAALTLQFLTRVRTCRADGSLCSDFVGPPAEAPPGCVPWYEISPQNRSGHRLVFGHWAAHGLLIDDAAIALDTGCVWGRELTAVRFDDAQVFQQPRVESG